jgi:hypothetical protein
MIRTASNQALEPNGSTNVRPADSNIPFHGSVHTWESEKGGPVALPPATSGRCFRKNCAGLSRHFRTCSGCRFLHSRGGEEPPTRRRGGPPFIFWRIGAVALRVFCPRTSRDRTGRVRSPEKRGDTNCRARGRIFRLTEAWNRDRDHGEVGPRRGRAVRGPPEG